MVERVTEIGDELASWLLSCWVDVSNAGGAVGFLPPVGADDVRPALDEHLAELAAGAGFLGVLRIDGERAGFGFVIGSTRPLFRHWATVLRLQVHPRFQGRGAGRALLDGLADLARADGLEFLHLTYRDGLGLGRFYESCGFVEVGRNPGSIRVAPGDDRDSVLMNRKL
ncbi:GNAT family N-acetyltransferase [Jiangella aurantiaca]|uniref:GNAT family N-acetyltransferase n=1 Tax=Jiangella aurantiaca TaxID=2530373 RepID=A0A4R5A6N0_9ACTN|nr:GNAT family N-acetyltransferase [Jiangella aurantiaca]TDD67778.1 GNAT family N-acetyltransferase [Jiangella aurantiaca]